MSRPEDGLKRWLHGPEIEVENPGYHVRKIKKGHFGSVSKVREELEELEDALDQGVKIMMFVEMADLYGALRALAANHGLTMVDLERMSNVTERAFQNGHRGGTDADPE